MKKKNSCFFPLFLWWFVVFAVKEKNIFIVNRMHDQVLNNRSWKQKKSFKNHLTKRLFWKKQHNHIKLPWNISALNSRFFENIVIPSKLDANRIIKFWRNLSAKSVYSKYSVRRASTKKPICGFSRISRHLFSESQLFVSNILYKVAHLNLSIALLLFFRTFEQT